MEIKREEEELLGEVGNREVNEIHVIREQKGNYVRWKGNQMEGRGGVGMSSGREECIEGIF